MERSVSVSRSRVLTIEKLNTIAAMVGLFAPMAIGIGCVPASPGTTPAGSGGTGGGQLTKGTGGKAGTGGPTASGGATGSGGSSATGSATSGGSSARGGTSGTGGAMQNGGATGTGAAPSDAGTDAPGDLASQGGQFGQGGGRSGAAGAGNVGGASVIADGGTGAPSFHCVNWAVNGDNFQPGTLLPSGILSTDAVSYDVFKSRATAVLNGYTDLLKANSFRMPINEPTVNTASYWSAYKAIIDAGVAKNMKVIIAFWAKDTGIGKPVDINTWYTMWTTVVNAYIASPTVYFDIHNEPHGYSNQQWIQQVKDWMAKFPSVPKNRIIVAGTGWDDNVANVAGTFSNMLLEVHDYSFNGTNTSTAWGNELIGRLGSGTSRTIVGEWGTGVRNVDFSTGVDSDNGKSFMVGFANAIHDHQMGSCWWPGLWAIPGNISSWSLLNLNGNGNNITYSIQNQSALDRIWHSWGLN